MKLRRRHRTLTYAALLLASLAWLVSAASLVCGRPLLHQAMAIAPDCAMVMAGDAGPAPHYGGEDCSDRPCLADSQPYDLAQVAKSDTPLLLALLTTALTLLIIRPQRLTRAKPPDPPDLKPIPLFQRYCVLRN
ncbi:MAG: hypothetical protein EPN21_03735 [Methylococcaceae bacterium]|nr:MAG: hypothetical protein EPN21_03735 [Methylococcaceae bacterium]